MTSSLTSLVFVALTSIGAACINISGVDLDGHEHEHGVRARDYTRARLLEKRSSRNVWDARLAALEQKMAGAPAIWDRSDYGGMLIYAGEYAKARDVLLEAERISPGHYAVASNLGTAYELLGDNVKALEWIREGMKRNPDSHDATEWVHVKILEAKIALEKDADWLSKSSVLGVDFGREARPKLHGMTEEQSARELYRIMRGAGYQLRERLQFVKPPDAIVADVLFDLGNAVAVDGNVQVASEIYTLASEYGVPRQDLFQARMELIRDINLKHAASQSRKIWIGGAITLGAGFGLFRYIRRRRLVIPKR
jgi:tetratricopeptide (TPR) repeat protein